jgi:hypothetical protein
MCALAPAQNQPDKEYVVSGFATEAMCHRLPLPSFTIFPSLGRSATKDRLTVKCIPGLLSLSFTIDTSVPSAFDQNIYTFRWGDSKVPGHSLGEGQFTHHEKLCAELVDLFYSILRKEVTSGSVPSLEPMHWSATCNPDDQWRTSMEIELSPYAEVRNPRTPSK